MKKQLTIVVYSFSEEYARESISEWFSKKPNLTVDLVTPYSQGSYEVSLSYEEEDSE